jgi:hypothetical protein
LSDTGSKPFSCWKCLRSFSRQDSLARHIKRDAHARTAESDLSGASDALPDHLASATLSANPQNYLFQDSGDAALPRVLEQQDQHLQDRLTSNNTIDNWMPGGQGADDPFFQLTWPDSEELLQSLLSANYSTWNPPVETLPCQPITANENQSSEGQARSPWLANDGVDNTGQSGSNAVRDLGRIITSLVGHHPSLSTLCEANTS